MDQTEQRRQIEQDLTALKTELDELVRNLPRHSIKPAHMQRIEELEEAIAAQEAMLARLEG